MDRRTSLQSMISGVGLSALATWPMHSSARRQTYVEARDGTRLFYQDWGAGRPIIFVAPWGLNSSWWEYQIHALASSDVRCIAFDRRGHGKSDQPGRGYDFDTLADDLAILVSTLGLRDVTLVGHSMGCAEVACYLARHKEKHVARAMLVSTITPLILKTENNPTGVDKAALENGRKMMANDRPHQIATGAAGFFGAPKNAVSASVMEWWTRMMVDHCSLRVLLELHRVFTETDFSADLKRITIPTLLIHGDSDTSARIALTAHRSVPLIRNAQLKIYEGAAHGLPFTHQERLNEDIRAFMK
jgi:non-heme chloroperoxidase